MNKTILGIQSYANHDAGASIIQFDEKSNEYIAISEERLSRKKYEYEFPLLSIDYCLKYFGIKKLSDVDLIVSDWIRIKRWLRSGPSYNYQLFDYYKEYLNFPKNKIIQIDHHLAHAASCYYTSSFKDSAILVVDGNGSDVQTNSFFEGNDNQIKRVDMYKNHGIGSAYAAVSREILGFGTGGEGKTMGLAPYGKYNKNIKINVKLDGVKTDLSKFMLRLPKSDVLNQINDNYRSSLIRKKSGRANKKNILNKKFRDWAFMIQNLSEKVMVHLGREIEKKISSKNICLTGGVALNSVANEKIYKKTKFKNIHIFPACSDSGLPFGLALWGYHNYYKKKKRVKFLNAYTGKNYSVEEITNLLNLLNIKFKINNSKEVAFQISKGKIIGIFNGKSEYGPRALGNRSIVADARRKDIRNKINKFIKHREIFRPFAPAILEKYSKKYFGVNHSPYMLRVSKCKYKSKIPSAIHVDNTARVQTVNKEQNLNFYELIESFYEITGIPVILNTSYNDAGEPLIETPLDSIICGLKTNLDYIYFENKIFVDLKKIKKNIKIELINKCLEIRNEKIKINYQNAKKNILKTNIKYENKIKFREENNKAKKYVLDRVKNKLDRIVKLKLKNNLIIGTNDHTNIIFNYERKFQSFFINSNFFELKENDIYKNKKRLPNLISESYLKKNINKYKTIFISTFEYEDKVFDLIKKYNFKGKVLNVYDNSSRSLIDFYFIKKFKGKIKMYSKNLI